MSRKEPNPPPSEEARKNRPNPPPAPPSTGVTYERFNERSNRMSNEELLEKCYSEGRTAFVTGKAIGDNPYYYNEGTDKFFSWEKGFKEEKERWDNVFAYFMFTVAMATVVGVIALIYNTGGFNG